MSPYALMSRQPGGAAIGTRMRRVRFLGTLQGPHPMWAKSERAFKQRFSPLSQISPMFHQNTGKPFKKKKNGNLTHKSPRPPFKSLATKRSWVAHHTRDLPGNQAETTVVLTAEQEEQKNGANKTDV